jgi:DNA-binding response OmpR family regulator
MGSYETSEERNADTPLIFVVEDDIDIARLICHHLNTAGYATRRFTESATVIDEAKKTLPALFLLDRCAEAAGKD